MSGNKVETNLVVLKKSRIEPKEGDVFCFRPRGRGYFLGRVISIEATIKSMTHCVLIYLFAKEYIEKVIPDQLLVGDLLVPPCLTNRLPWSKGYFETIGNRKFVPGEKLPVHCFLDVFFKEEARYFDEFGNIHSDRFDPCGIYGLGSYRTIDDAVSNALGMELVRD